MFRFENPIYLYLLVLIPMLVLLRRVMQKNRKKRLKKFGDLDLLKSLMPDVSNTRRAVKFWLLMAALALIIVMLARPQMGSKISNETRNGIEAIIALDISNSMMAEDVVPSRLDKSKMLIENMVDNFTNDKVGLVVFAGDAFIQLPITSDYVSAKMFMQNTTPSLIASQGTNIAEAIRMASSSFTKAENIGRAIIVITDGEDHEGGAEEAAAAAKKKGINVFVLGVGSTKDLYASITSPANCNDTVTWTSSSGKVATVTPTGDGKTATITAVQLGNCTVRVKTGSGKYKNINVSVYK